MFFWNRSFSLFAISAILNLNVCIGTGASELKTKARPSGLNLTSSAFREGGPIPKKFTCDGSNFSPELNWSGAPSLTKTFALICDDPDAPGGTWVHWVLYDLPGGITHLADGVATEGKLPSGAKQGTNSFFKIGYGGPSPPRGKAHRYFFKLFALDKSLELQAGRSAGEVEKAMTGHVLGETKLMGTYMR